MTSRFALLLAALGLCSLSCKDDGNGGTSQAIASKLRQCGLVGTGQVNPYVGASQVAQCQAECLAAASCEELKGWYCNNTESARLRDCERACFGPQSCADKRGTYRNDQRCDGIYQCDDKSDERDCPKPTDEGPQYCASSGDRIYEYMRCDGVDDCGDGTDEDNCPNPPASFRCVRKRGNLVQEIPMEKVCDLAPDCLDMSDESPDQGCATLQCNGSP